MNRTFLPLVTVATLCLTACGSLPKPPPAARLAGGDYAPLIEYLKAYIPSRVKAHGFTGLSVALLDDQRIVWSAGFGQADKAPGAAATASTAYRAGSVSKLFTAMAVMKLAEQGTLDLDAPITDTVPTFDLTSRFGSIDGITLRNLLSHHSGLPNAIRDGLFASEPDAFETVTTRLARYHASYPRLRVPGRSTSTGPRLPSAWGLTMRR